MLVLRDAGDLRAYRRCPPFGDPFDIRPPLMPADMPCSCHIAAADVDSAAFSPIAIDAFACRPPAFVMIDYFY